MQNKSSIFIILKIFFKFGIKNPNIVNITSIISLSTKGGLMFFINDLKRIITTDVIIIFLIVSYILIFRTSRDLKRKNMHRDYKIVRFTGIIYGISAIAAVIVISI